MGYDISAYIPKATPDDPARPMSGDELYDELAYLRMGAHSSDAPHLFTALGAPEYDKQVSGSGIGRCFSAEQLKSALRELCSRYAAGTTSARVVRFVAQACEADRPWVYIDFG